MQHVLRIILCQECNAGTKSLITHGDLPTCIRPSPGDILADVSFITPLPPMWRGAASGLGHAARRDQKKLQDYICDHAA